MILASVRASTADKESSKIKMSGSLIKARASETLCFVRRITPPLFADNGIQAIGQGNQIAVKSGSCNGIHYQFVAGILFAELDVLAHRLGEQNLLLGNVPDPAVELIGRQHLHGDVGNEDFAGSGRVLMEKRFKSVDLPPPVRPTTPSV